MRSLFRYCRWTSQFKKSPPIFSLYSTATIESRPRSSPPPIRVGVTESVGRAVFATRRIATGELIHTAKPIVAHPSLSSLHKVCYLCLRNLPSNKTQSAGADPTVAFCSEHCELQSKNFHEIEKKGDWSRLNEYCRMQGLKYPLLVKRFACQVISGVVSADSLNILQPATLTFEMVSLMEKEFFILRSTFEETDIKAEQMAFLTKEWYTGLLARMRINAFRVELAGGGSYEDFLSSAAASVEAEVAVGNAVYMLPSFYNHDCDPNLHILWVGNADARIKALRDIETGEELRICYIDASMNHQARQKVLQEGFGFLCNCPRCLSND